LVSRTTFIVDGPLALRSQRLTAAREGAIGRDILTLPLLAARLAGGFIAPVGTDVLFPAIQTALAADEFNDIASVAGLPGMPRAVLQSLDAAWRADIDLASLPSANNRLADLSRIEERIRQAAYCAASPTRGRSCWHCRRTIRNGGHGCTRRRF